MTAATASPYRGDLAETSGKPVSLGSTPTATFRFRFLIPLAAIGFVWSAAVHPAWADGGKLMPRNVPDAYTQECGSCHIAYPPGMLPARSWQRLMGGLDKHYGSDASLDAATLRQISLWLQANAGTYKRVNEEPPQDRITRSAWFKRKHRKIDSAVWKHASVKTPGNCAACHAGAGRGLYDDDDLRFPAGLDARFLRAWND